MPRPANLLFLLSDNHARSVLGCYGNQAAVTPRLDALAASGARFANAYTASPLCCPARAALATGRYPHRTGYWDNAIPYDGRVRSWMHELREAGHDVVSIGKLHFRSTKDDNGFSREIAPMHILNAKGGVSMLLRWSGEEPVNRGQWELYFEKSGIGYTDYQRYDRDITCHAVAWLHEAAARAETPWALFVSYVSAHPPFTVPQRLYDLYEGADLPLPPLFRPAERPHHPAIDHLRATMGTRAIEDEAALREVVRCYHALSSHLDEQIGAVLDAAEGLGLLKDTRVIYSSDHGESAGAHGLLGKSHMYDPALGVPLIMAGPDLPRGLVIEEPVSHVDLYPTIVEGAGLPIEATRAPLFQGEKAPPKGADEGSDPTGCTVHPHPTPLRGATFSPREKETAPATKALDGESLWPIIAGRQRSQPVLAEYHAAGSKNASFALRSGAEKLIYHVGAPPELFDIAADPEERSDLAGTAEGRDRAAALEAELCAICDPEAVDRRAKEDQRRKAEFWGGNAAILKEGLLVYTPPPGVEASIEPAEAGPV